MTEGQKRKINKESGPKNNIISVKEREREVLDSVPEIHRKSLEKIIQEYRDVFPEKLPKGAPPNREVQHRIEIEPGSDPHIGLLTDWVLLSRMSLRNRSKISWLRVSFDHRAVRTGHQSYLCPRKTADGECILITGR